jgi:hypothetical protein
MTSATPKRMLGERQPRAMSGCWDTGGGLGETNGWRSVLHAQIKDYTQPIIHDLTKPSLNGAE